MLLIIVIISGWSIVNDIIRDYLNFNFYLLCNIIFSFISFIPSLFTNFNVKEFSFSNHIKLLVLNHLFYIYLIINNIILITVTENSPMLVSLILFLCLPMYLIVIDDLLYSHIIQLLKIISIYEK